MDVTVDLIGEVGIDAVDIGAIVERAGVTTGALYHHFRDLPHLLEGAVAHRFPLGVRSHLDAMSAALEQATTKEDFQHAMVALSHETHQPTHRNRRMERARYVALTSGNESLRALIAEQQRGLTDRLTTLLAEIQHRGWLRNDLNPRAVAVFLQACTLGRIVDDVTHDPLDPQDWNHLVATIITRVLSG